MVDVVPSFVALVAQAGRLLPGLADVGADARSRAVVTPLMTPSALVRAAGQLAAQLPEAGLEPSRARWLGAGLRALECTCRRLAGQDVGFVKEVADTFGVTIRAGDDGHYRQAHVELADLLPGRRPLVERLAAHRRRDEVPRDRLLPAVRALSAALRDRARAMWPLPAAEDVGYRLVADAPWTALHTWLGPHRSLVTVNAGARLRWSQLPGLVAHEAYPGHHVQRCRAALAARGRPEQAMVLVRSPQAVVAEGAAEVGLEVLVGPEWGRWAEDVLAPVLGAPSFGSAVFGGTVFDGAVFDGVLAERLVRAGRALLPVRQDAALLLHGRRIPHSEVRRHLRRWLLVDEARAGRIVESLASPLWRGHVAAHVEGPPMVNSWLRQGAGSLTERYLRLLDEPFLPLDLRLTGAGSDMRLVAAEATASV